jgi:hypothetical protein
LGKLLNLFINLCLLRAKPQDVPASWFLLGLIVATYILVSLALAAKTLPPAHAVFFALADVAILALFTYAVLLLRSFPERFLQTLTALVGVGALFGLVAWPMLALPGQQYTLLIYVLMLWNIAVMAFILREALAVSFILSLAASLGYFSISLIALGALFPVATPTL